MLELTLTLLDKIGQLIGARAERKRRQFTEIVERVFPDLERVHTDYLKLFEETLRSLKSGEPIVETLSAVSKDRLELEALRRHLKAIVDATKKDGGLADLHSFAQAVHWYLMGASTRGAGTLSHMLEDVLEVASGDYPPEGDNRQRAIEVTTHFLRHIRNAWQDVNEEYAKLLKSQI